MPFRRASAQAVKKDRSYSVPELALCLGVHKGTVRAWQRRGLETLDTHRPALLQGATVRAFLKARSASRKRPCPPGTIYCFRCREPRPPALGMVDYHPITERSGNLTALCDPCGATMFRRARRAELEAKMPNLAVQIREASPRLKGSPGPSLNHDSEQKAMR